MGAFVWKDNSILGRMLFRPIHQIRRLSLDVTFKGEKEYTLARVHMWLCTCKLIPNRGIWIIYLATIQLGTSLVFTFYHQGHWMSAHSDPAHDTCSVRISLHNREQQTRPRKMFMWREYHSVHTEKKKEKRLDHAGSWLSVALLHRGHCKGTQRLRGDARFTQWPQCLQRIV